MGGFRVPVARGDRLGTSRADWVSKYSEGAVNRRTAILVTCLLGCLRPTLAQEKASHKLFESVVNGKIGFVDASCRFVIPPQFEETLGFSEGLASVKMAGKWGYIDSSGAYVVPPRFAGAFPFSDGLASVQLHENESWGFIDKSGDVVIAPQFSFPLFFSEGLVGAYGRRDGIEGIAMGYIDKKGVYVIDFRSHTNERITLSNFSDGLAHVDSQILRDEGGLGPSTGGYIDKNGKLIIPKLSDSLGSFHEGLASSYIQGKWGFMDRQGKVAITPQFEWVLDFSASLAAVKMANGWGYLDGQGKIAIPPQFEEAHNFVDGLALVKMGGKLGYVNLSGQLVIPPRFDSASEFSDGIATVQLGDAWMLVDRGGRTLCRLP